MEWTKKQLDFLNIAGVSSGFVFLTGKAGTGKTTILKEFINRHNKPVVKLATTGIAATLFGGQTIHSFFAIPPLNILTEDNCIFVKRDTRLLWNMARVIIIDEASMLRPDIIDFIDLQLKKNNCKSLSSKLIIFAGDFKQLQPITDNTSKPYLEERYGHIDFRNAHCINNLKTIELDEVKRQSNPIFINSLNVIREGKPTKYFDRFKKNTNNGIRLCPYRAQADKYNTIELNKLKGKSITFNAIVEGQIKPSDFTIPFSITVKEGAKIMYLTNDENLSNGDIGVFRVINDKYFFESKKGIFRIVPIQMEKQKYIYDEDDGLKLITVGSIQQMPIQLAFAITIHKSQGQTFEEITIDNSKGMFTENQLYVALSRVTGPKGLSII